MGGAKRAALISFILNNKKDFDYLSFTIASGLIILNDCDQVCNYFLHYFQHFQVVIFVRFTSNSVRQHGFDFSLSFPRIQQK
jgi:hypothetical protein